MTFFGATCNCSMPLHRSCNPLKDRSLVSARIVSPRFPQHLPQCHRGALNSKESNQQLDAETFLTHVCCRHTDRMSDLIAYVDGGSLGNPGPSGIGVVIDGSARGKIRIAK